MRPRLLATCVALGKDALFAVAFLSSAGLVLAQETLPGSQPLSATVDLSAQMVAGIGRFLDRQTEKGAEQREKYWRRDLSSPEAYEASIRTNRDRLLSIIGATDTRSPVRELTITASTRFAGVVYETDNVIARAVSWPVLQGVSAEGLWLLPKNSVLGRAVVIPDADQTPEMVAGIPGPHGNGIPFARRLAERGCEVLVPVLISRSDTFSGNPTLNRFTNQPHREWIYRQAYEMGRHIIGYEVQKVLAAVDWFESLQPGSRTSNIGVAGYGEGGLIAFYAAALDPRIDACLVSGYFDSRQGLWREPIYRSVFGLLREFGDAEIACLIAPRALLIEHSIAPRVDGPPPVGRGRSGAAPGRIGTPESSSVRSEFDRARTFLKTEAASFSKNWLLLSGEEGSPLPPFSDSALRLFTATLGLVTEDPAPAREATPQSTAMPHPDERQQRQVRELEEFTQALQRSSERVRNDSFWSKLEYGSVEKFSGTTTSYQRQFHQQIMGFFGAPTVPLNARSRKILEREKWTGFEVLLDVYPDVFAWGYLLLPKSVKPGERRPVVVCQHGLEGVPADTVNEDPKTQAFGYYKAFAARLAERGFVVFSPHNPYRGGDKFRELQRKANPLGGSLFSIIIAQHDQILKWLATLPFVDAQRIGFYGLSYGGKTAMRVPAVLEAYCLSICSGDFNEWVRKNVSVDAPLSYMFTGEYEMPEWNLGHTFNYAEMAALIAPRPFMVERGHNDGVGLDEWVAYEYAKVQRLYDHLGISDRTTIEYFNGPHTINGVGTFEFLNKHLDWTWP